jgi:hypothetical protein
MQRMTNIEVDEASQSRPLAERSAESQIQDLATFVRFELSNLKKSGLDNQTLKYLMNHFLEDDVTKQCVSLYIDNVPVSEICVATGFSKDESLKQVNGFFRDVRKYLFAVSESELHQVE